MACRGASGRPGLPGRWLKVDQMRCLGDCCPLVWMSAPHRSTGLLLHRVSRAQTSIATRLKPAQSCVSSRIALKLKSMRSSKTWWLLRLPSGLCSGSHVYCLIQFDLRQGGLGFRAAAMTDCPSLGSSEMPSSSETRAHKFWVAISRHFKHVKQRTIMF